MFEAIPDDVTLVSESTCSTSDRIAANVRRSLTPVTLTCIGLGLVGCLAVYNATFHLDNPFQFVEKQAVWLVFAAAVLIFTSCLSLRHVMAALPIVAGASYLSLWLVLQFGIRVNGMRGWFAWNGIFLQPSEMGKPIFVLVLAALLTRTAKERDSVVKGYLPALALCVAWILPIALEPDFGSVLIYFLAFALVYVCMGGPVLHVVFTGFAALPGVAILIYTVPYLKQRMVGFLDPTAYPDSAGWHILQFQRTLASGGMIGRSWGKGLWSQTYLPFGYSDSIFATIGEAVGFLGTLPLVLIILLWVIYGYRRIQQCDDYFTACVIAGMVVMLAGQACLHLSVNLGMCPPTGITLPLISYGGSSLIATVIAVGVVEALARQNATPADT